MTTPTTGDALGLNATLAMTIRRFRTRRGLRQTDIAEALGWPVSRVTRIEGGETLVKVVDLPALCRAFDVPLVVLLFGADPAELNPLGLLEGASEGTASLSRLRSPATCIDRCRAPSSHAERPGSRQPRHAPQTRPLNSLAIESSLLPDSGPAS